MSWQIFKDNIVRMSDNPDAIPDIDTVAKTYAREYDAAIKRGKDIIEGVSLQKGNVEIMESLFKAALEKGLTSTEPYDLVGEMGKGVIAYWGGAIMNNFPNPKTLPPGAVSNISVTSNIVMDPGKWQASPTKPASARFNDPEEELDMDAQENNIDNGQAEEFYAIEPLTDDEVTNAEEERKLYPLNTPQLETAEVELIQQPEEIVYVESESVIDLEEGSSKEPNQPITNNKINADVSGAKVYKNIGGGGAPPGFEKYVIDRTGTFRKGAKKPDGPNGGIPDSVMVTVNGGSYGSGQLHPEAAKFLSKFIAQAKKDNVKFSISSWYRPYANQVKCWNELEAGKAAVPGHSNHGWGIAIDVRDLYRAVGGSIQVAANAEVRKNNDLYKYFAKNAPTYGWYNPSALCDGNKPEEVWHWEYHGFKTLTKAERENAMKS
jgi:hypothetical protein